MGNYIATIEVYKATTTRTTQVNLRSVTITDLESARKAIDNQLKTDGFEYTQEELDAYYITMLAKVDEPSLEEVQDA